MADNNLNKRLQTLDRLTRAGIIFGITNENLRLSINELDPRILELIELLDKLKLLNEQAFGRIWVDNLIEVLQEINERELQNQGNNYFNIFSYTEFEDQINLNEDNLLSKNGIIRYNAQIFELLPDLEDLEDDKYEITYSSVLNVPQTYSEISVKLTFTKRTDEDKVEISDITIQILTNMNGVRDEFPVTPVALSDHFSLYHAWDVNVTIDGTSAIGTETIEDMEMQILSRTIASNLAVLLRATVIADKEADIRNLTSEFWITSDGDQQTYEPQRQVLANVLVRDSVHNAETLEITTKSYTTSLPLPEENVSYALTLRDSEILMTPGDVTDVIELGIGFLLTYINEVEFIDSISLTIIYAQQRKSQIVQEMIDQAYQDGNYLATIGFDTIAKVDALIATVPRYEEQEVTIPTMIGAFNFQHTSLNPIAGTNTQVSPYLYYGCNELGRTVAVTPQSNESPYTMNVRWNATNNSPPERATTVTIYRDDEYTVLLDASYLISNDAPTTTDMDRIGFLRQTSGSTVIGGYYLNDLRAQEFGRMTETRHVGQVPLYVTNATHLVRVNSLTVLDHRSGTAPIVTDGSATIRLSNVDMAAPQDIAFTDINLTNPHAVLVTIDGLQVAGVQFEVNHVISNKLFNNDGDYAWAVYNTQGPWNITSSSRIISQNENIINTEITSTTNLDPSWTASTGVSYVVNSRYRVARYPQSGVTITTMAEMGLTFSQIGAVLSSNLGLYVRGPMGSIMSWVDMQKGMIDQDNERRPWTNFFDKMNTVETIIEGVNPLDLIHAVGFDIRNLTLTYQVLLPPTNVGVQRIFDTSTRDLALVIDSALLSIADIQANLADIRNQMEHMQQQIRDMMGSDTAWGQVLNAVLSVVTDVAIGAALGGLGLAAKALVTQTVSAAKLFTASMIRATKSLANMKIQVRGGARATTIEAINKHTFFKNTTMDAKYGGNFSSRIPNTLNPDVNLNAGENFRWTSLLPEFSLGSRKAAFTARRGDNSLLMNVPADYAGPLHKFAIHYQPLKVSGLENLTNKAFSKINFKDLDAQYMYRANKSTSRRPAHAWSSMQSYEQNNGNIIRTTQVFGVGEHAGLNSGDMTGRIRGIKFKENISSRNDANGKIVSQLLPYGESGYSVQDVERLFFNMFKVEGRYLSTDRKWQILHHNVSNNVMNSKVAHEFTFASPYMHYAIDDLIKNPPNLRYNLWNRNCQHLVDDLNRWIKGYPIGDTWGLNLQNRMESIVLRQMGITLDVIGSTPTLRLTFSPKIYFRQVRDITNKVTQS